VLHGWREDGVVNYLIYIIKKINKQNKNHSLSLTKSWKYAKENSRLEAILKQKEIVEYEKSFFSRTA
jgi:hypothetical protein